MEMADGTTISGTLNLHNVNDSVAFFSERPDRRAGSVTLNEFLENWDLGHSSFLLQPPNAGFIYYAPSKSPRARTAHYSEVNLVLRNPKYDSKSDTLSFDVTLLTPAMKIPAGELLEPTLFIDSGSRNNDS
ncbi:MAG: hypothetical protein SP1CHLAM42_09180 [Chlamydiales bacterium]|nr:hypothetical protein [Chlamydiales bacterium]